MTALSTEALQTAMQRHDLAQLQSAIATAEAVGGMEEAAVMKEAKVRVVHASFRLKHGIHAHVRIVPPRFTNERVPAPLPTEPFRFSTDACSTTHFAIHHPDSSMAPPFPRHTKRCWRRTTRHACRWARGR